MKTTVALVLSSLILSGCSNTLTPSFLRTQCQPDPSVMTAAPIPAAPPITDSVEQHFDYMRYLLTEYRTLQQRHALLAGHVEQECQR